MNLFGSILGITQSFVVLRGYMKYSLLIIVLVGTAALGYFMWERQQDQQGQEKASNDLESALAEEGAPALPGGQGAGSTRDIAKVNKKKQDNSDLDLDQRYAYVSNNQDYPTLTDRLTAMSERRNGREYSDEEVVAAMEGKPWEEIDEVPSALVLTEEDKTDGREFIRFNPMKIESLMPGDTLKLPMNQIGEELQVRIDQVIVNEGGSLTWQGKLLNDPDGNSVIITQSEKLTVAGIGTGQGHFELQAHNNVGWIASSQTLFKQNFNETDAIVPPHEH